MRECGVEPQMTQMKVDLQRDPAWSAGDTQSVAKTG